MQKEGRGPKGERIQRVSSIIPGGHRRVSAPMSKGGNKREKGEKKSPLTFWAVRKKTASKSGAAEKTRPRVPG